MAVNEVIVDTVSIDNMKTIAEAGAAAQAMQFGQNQAAAARLNVIAENALQAGITLAQAATSAAVKLLLEVDPGEAASVGKVLTGNDLAQTLASLLAAINSGQQGVKSAGNTPPVTP